MFLNLDIRSNESELMDNPLVEKEKLNEALEDLSRVNSLLGGNKITVNAVFNQIRKINLSTPLVIMDLGCGNGEMLRLIANRARKENIMLELVGLDINQNCIEQARELSSEYPEVVYSDQNILDLKKEDYNIDILICTLTLHHLTDNEIVKVLSKSKHLVSNSFIINDLHRSALAYYLFKGFSYFFIKGFIAKNDGLVSIKRGFRRNELKSFVKSTGLKNFEITWRWAFRYRFIIKL